MIKVFAEGRVAATPKLFQYGEGGYNNSKTGIGFGLICNKFYNDENPTYLQCTIFNRDEKTAQYITVGRQMVVHGSLRCDNKGYYSLIIEDFSYGQVPQNQVKNEEKSYSYIKNEDERPFN